MFSSYLYMSLKNRFRDIYQLNGILGNDRDALISRVFFVQRNEPRSNYIYEPS